MTQVLSSASNNFGGQSQATKHHYPILFLEEWPQPPKYVNEEHYESSRLNEVIGWRFQSLLAVNPWGIPMMAFPEAYEKMFGRRLDVQELGFKCLSDMILSLPEIFTVRDADETTAQLFKDYDQDKILIDARIQPDESLIRSQATQVNQQVDCANLDPETLISYAWINRDEDFPSDVVLPGEQYADFLLVASAKVPGTLGVYRARITGAYCPDTISIAITNGSSDKIDCFSSTVDQYFRECQLPISMYSVPDEFIYPGFPCLWYNLKESSWERCEIVSRHKYKNKILIETVDYGGIHSINSIFLYLMPRKFLEVPKQGFLVSLLGIKAPTSEKGWSKNVGARIRNFSEQDYNLDCLLVEPQKSLTEVDESISGNDDQKSISGSIASDSTKADLKVKKKHLRRSKARFEVLMCDRNDNEIDLFLDDILVLETLANVDEERLEEITDLKEKFKVALKSLQRPTNPLAQTTEEQE